MYTARKPLCTIRLHCRNRQYRAHFQRLGTRFAPSVTYVANGRNLGIAAAINQGVQQLIDAGCANALIFDQDSEPSAQLLEGLPQLVDAAVAGGRPVAVVGPAYEDIRLGGVAPFVRFGYMKLLRIMPVGDELIDVDFLISSGSCLNLAAWQDIGPMDDALFIDFVDLEWCIRARSKGYAVLGAPQLRLAHELGGEPIKILGRPYPSQVRCGITICSGTPSR